MTHESRTTSFLSLFSLAGARIGLVAAVLACLASAGRPAPATAQPVDEPDAVAEPDDVHAAEEPADDAEDGDEAPGDEDDAPPAVPFAEEPTAQAPAPDDERPAPAPVPVHPERDASILVPDAGAAAPERTMLMNFHDAPLAAVLKEISQQLGLAVIDGDRADGRVTIESRAPMTERQIVAALNSVLKVKGLAAVQIGRTLRITTLDEARTSTLPVHSGSDPARIGQSDTLIRQIIPVRYGNAERLARDLAAIVPPYAILGSNAASNTLIYTATEADARHLVEIVRALDVSQSSAYTVSVFRLENADAASAATLVQNVFSPDTRSQQNAANQRAFRRPFGPGGGEQQTPSDDGVRVQRVVAAADRQTNAVVVSAPAEIMDLIGETLREIDTNPLRPNDVRVFNLEFADATNTARLIEDIFSSDQQSSSSSRTGFRQFVSRLGGPGGNGTTQGTVASQRVAAAADAQTNSIVVTASPSVMDLIAEVVRKIDTMPTAEESIFVYPLSNAQASELESVLQDIFEDRTTASSRTGGRTAAFAGRNGATGRGGTGTNGSALADSAGDLAGKVYIVAEESTNSLLVRTAPKYFQRVKEILKELDRPTRQVLIKVLIAEVTLDDLLDLGAEFSVLNLDFGGPGTGQVGTNFGLSPLSSGLVARYVDPDFDITLRALQQVGRLNVLSRPYLLASENQAARITVGEEVPYITNSRVTEAGQVVNSVDYRDIGIIMEITPYIGPDGMVILDLSQEISSRTGRTVTVSEDFAAEVYAKRLAETRVSIANGQTIVIGGLMKDSLTETSSGVPLLCDIPLVGALFRRTVTETQKTELLLFLCPQTALTPAELQTVSDRTAGQADQVRQVGQSGDYERSLQEIAPTPRTSDIADQTSAGATQP
ncbi:MAG: hypothetical protein GX591_07995 [Planctomycetes bacterium]|nr:hypothetical protein [Planctomycetota bacterium]